MNNQPDTSQTDEAAEDDEVFRRWRSICRSVSALVANEVEGLVNAARGGGDDDNDGGKKNTSADAPIRRLSALVIVAQRSMELQDRYEQNRAAGEPASEDYREQARRDVANYEDKIKRLVAARCAGDADRAGADQP